MEYSDKVMDHFANPRNTGRIENPSGQGTVGNPTCGDLMTIYIDGNSYKQHDYRNGCRHAYRGCFKDIQK